MSKEQVDAIYKVIHLPGKINGSYMDLSIEERRCLSHDMKGGIFGFFKEHRFLSNFHECPIRYQGLNFKSSEAAYQAMKSLDREDWVKFTQFTPYEAMEAGRKKIQVRAGWNHEKMYYMRDILEQKFVQNKEIRDKLMETKNMYLEETNWWGDKYWGVCDGIGENHLGKLLMSTRIRL